MSAFFVILSIVAAVLVGAAVIISMAVLEYSEEGDC